MLFMPAAGARPKETKRTKWIAFVCIVKLKSTSDEAIQLFQPNIELVDVTVERAHQTNTERDFFR